MKTFNLWQTATLLLYFISASAQTPIEVVETPQHEQIANRLSAELAQVSKTVSKQYALIDSLKGEIHELEAASIQEEESAKLNIAGFEIAKDELNSALGFLCGLSTLVAFIYFFRFRNSNFVTRKASAALLNLEEEHEEHVRISLEREQKLRRQLQDEINRHKISQAS